MSQNIFLHFLRNVRFCNSLTFRITFSAHFRVLTCHNISSTNNQPYKEMGTNHVHNLEVDIFQNLHLRAKKKILLSFNWQKTKLKIISNWYDKLNASTSGVVLLQNGKIIVKYFFRLCWKFFFFTNDPRKSLNCKEFYLGHLCNTTATS